MFQQIIDLLLQEKASLDNEMALDIEVVVNEIKAKYAERSEKVDAMLSLAGYVPVIEEVVEETDTVDEVVDEVVDTSPDTVDEVVDEVVDGGNATEAESGKAFYSI